MTVSRGDRRAADLDTTQLDVIEGTGLSPEDYVYWLDTDPPEVARRLLEGLDAGP